MAAFVEIPDPPSWYDAPRAAGYRLGYRDALRNRAAEPSSVGDPCIGICDACGDEDGPWVPTLAGWLCEECDERTSGPVWNDDTDCGVL